MNFWPKKNGQSGDPPPTVRELAASIDRQERRQAGVAEIDPGTESGLSNTLEFSWSVRMVGPANGAISSIYPLRVRIHADGSWQFDGHMRNDNLLPYQITLTTLICSGRGSILRLSANGVADAALPWNNNSWAFELQGSCRDFSRDLWLELKERWTWQSETSVKLGTDSMFQLAPGVGSLPITVWNEFELRRVRQGNAPAPDNLTARLQPGFESGSPGEMVVAHRP